MRVFRFLAKEVIVLAMAVVQLVSADCAVNQGVTCKPDRGQSYKVTPGQIKAASKSTGAVSSGNSVCIGTASSSYNPSAGWSHGLSVWTVGHVSFSGSTNTNGDFAVCTATIEGGSCTCGTK